MVRATILLILFGATAARGTPSKRVPIVNQISFAIEHKADGRKYAVPVSESYTLDAKGELHYFAYFFDMPIEMNHTDSVDWTAGATGVHVLENAATWFDELEVLPDGKETPNGGFEIYVVDFTRDAKESRRYVFDHKAKGWSELDAAFQGMVAAFEKATGRPIPPNKLPQ